MFLSESRRKRESVIVQAMIRIFCKAHHSSDEALCKQCLELSDYASKRLLSCMYGDYKPVCKVCPVHCYSPVKREQMRQVMRWAGPRMIFRNPVFALTHIFDNLKANKTQTKSATNISRKK